MSQTDTPFADRLLPARPDLAAKNLQGKVSAKRFVTGAPHSVVAPILNLTMEPSETVNLATQLLYGETFMVYETREDGYSWGQCTTDGYVGFVKTSGLGSSRPFGKTITAVRSHVYSRPDMKSPVLHALPCGARVHISNRETKFAALETGGYVPLQHLEPVRGDLVDQMRRFLGTPYLWGGRSSEGLDCSALIQLGMTMMGLNALRDTDMQEARLGHPAPKDQPLARGDIIFWKTHVGILTDPNTLLHANAFHMATIEEPLKPAVERIKAQGDGPITSRRCLPIRAFKSA